MGVSDANMGGTLRSPASRVNEVIHLPDGIRPHFVMLSKYARTKSTWPVLGFEKKKPFPSLRKGIFPLISLPLAHNAIFLIHRQPRSALGAR